MLNQIQGKSGKILLAVFAGLSAGMIAGLLMAPQTRSSLRKGLARNAKQVRTKVRNAFKEYNQHQQLPETG